MAQEVAEVSGRADAPAEAVGDGLAAGDAGTAGFAGARVITKPRVAEQRRETVVAGEGAGLEFGDVVEREEQAGKNTGRRIVIGRADEAVAGEAVSGYGFQPVAEETDEFADGTGLGVVADMDAHFHTGEVEAVEFAGDHRVLVAEGDDGLQRLVVGDEGVAGVLVVIHREDTEGQDACTGRRVGGREFGKDRLDGGEFERSGVSPGAFEIKRGDGFFLHENEVEHAVAGIPAAGPKDVHRRFFRRGIHRREG